MKTTTQPTNLHIIPYESDEAYKSNVDKILTALTSSPNIKSENVMLTEGEYSYIFNSHDAYLYASKYNLQYRDHSTISGMITDIHKPWNEIKYIVCIGTWSAGIVSLDFIANHPDITVIHIQGPVLPKQYSLDVAEHLTYFNTDINTLIRILSCEILLKEIFKINTTFASIITDDEHIVDFINKKYPNIGKLTYANRVALHSEIKKQQPTIVILENYSKSTIDFIRSNCKSVEVYYPENSIEYGLAMDELEAMGEPTKPPKIHYYQ